MKTEEEIRERLLLHLNGKANAVNGRQDLICDVRAKELDWVLEIL